MIKFWNRRRQSPLLTENLHLDRELEEIKQKIQDKIKQKFAGSLAIRMVDSGSCNACEAECNALSNPYYDLERLGIYFVASPRHADVMLVSGVMTFNMTPHVRDAYEQIPKPKWVISMGDCPLDGGVFEKTYAINAPASDHLPIAHHIAGCPPTPLQIIQGLLEFLDSLE